MHKKCFFRGFFVFCTCNRTKIQMQYTLFDLNSPIFAKLYKFKNCTELGAIYEVIDWEGLCKLLPDKQTHSGAPSWLKPQGYFGMMFLKHYLNLSDEKLLERFNTDWALQLFCGALIPDNEMIKDNSFVSSVRSYLGKYVDFEDFQTELLDHWKVEIPNKNVASADATCYEVYMRYPTDVKLLWESCEWLWDNKMVMMCKSNKLKMPRSKFKEQKQKYLNYGKLKKKSYRKTKTRRRALLYLLDKGIKEFQGILDKTKAVDLKPKDADTFKTIKKVYQQQKHLFDVPQAKIKDRIVSLFKPYIRPIVRGKENKPVEFGIKAHIVQVGRINIIEHYNYQPFNECKRLKISIVKHKIRFGECSHIAADKIYHTNENRRYTTKNKIKTNFCRKGKGKDDKETKQMKALLNKERSTSLEGSFGNEKNHYLLRKIKARNPKTETVWLHFGVYTANAVKIAKQRKKKPILQAA